MAANKKKPTSRRAVGKAAKVPPNGATRTLSKIRSHKQRTRGHKRRLRPGQPSATSKLNDRLTRRFCDEVRCGLAYSTCCKLVRVSEASFHDWMLRGSVETDDGLETPYTNFYKAVEAANAEAEKVTHAKVLAANPAWILGRRWPSHYPSERQQLELSGKDGGPIAVAVPSIKIFTDGLETPAFPFRDESQADESGLPIEQTTEAPAPKIQIPKSLSGPLSARLSQVGGR